MNGWMQQLIFGRINEWFDGWITEWRKGWMSGGREWMYEWTEYELKPNNTSRWISISIGQSFCHSSIYPFIRLSAYMYVFVWLSVILRVCLCVRPYASTFLHTINYCHRLLNCPKPSFAALRWDVRRIRLQPTQNSEFIFATSPSSRW